MNKINTKFDIFTAITERDYKLPFREWIILSTPFMCLTNVQSKVRLFSFPSTFQWPTHTHTHYRRFVECKRW